MAEVILIVDMLRGFLEEGFPLFCGHKAREIIPSVISLLEEKKKAKIIYACDAHEPDDPEFKLFPPHCIKGTPEAEIIPELKSYPGKIIEKTRFSALFNTELEDLLRKISPEEITVVGVCTHICILYTVADLRFRDYKVIVPEDCVASFDEKAHDFALKEMEKTLGATVLRKKHK